MESTIDNKIPQGLPSEVRAWLSQASQTLIESLGEELEALVLFGSAAEGLMRASSDVNLLVVLNRFDPERIDRASAILQDAAAAVELHPMFLLASELPLAGESFSVKFDDIAHRHIVLYGKDPFEGLTIPRGLIVKRLQQVLFNLTLRLRTIYRRQCLRRQGAAAFAQKARAGQSLQMGLKVQWACATRSRYNPRFSFEELQWQRSG